MNKLEQVLRWRFPTIDIRADQTDVIRLISNTIVAGCSEKNGLCRAKVVSLEASDLDYEDELIADIEESTPEKLADRLARFFEPTTQSKN